VLLGLFFITIGMMLDWHPVLERWALVLVLLAAPLLSRPWWRAGAALGATTGVALRTGLYLAQAGEFGFVLLSLMQTHELLAPALMNPVLAAMVLSMLATPFLIQYSNRIVMKLVASDWLQQSLQVTASRAGHQHQATCSSAATAAAARTWRACWSARASPTWRWTWTPTACARPPPPATRWCLAMPRACRPDGRRPGRPRPWPSPIWTRPPP
jgi:hypothetical protein